MVSPCAPQRTDWDDPAQRAQEGGRASALVASGLAILLVGGLLLAWVQPWNTAVVAASDEAVAFTVSPGEEVAFVYLSMGGGGGVRVGPSDRMLDGAPNAVAWIAPGELAEAHAGEPWSEPDTLSVWGQDEEVFYELPGRVVGIAGFGGDPQGIYVALRGLPDAMDGPPEPGIYRIDRSSGSVEPIATGGGVYTQPVQVGEEVAFIVQPSASTIVNEVSVADQGGEARIIPTGELRPHSLSPRSGRSVCLEAWPPGANGTELYVLDVETGAAEQISQGPLGRPVACAFERDGYYEGITDGGGMQGVHRQDGE
jgi:hypothetical protein